LAQSPYRILAPAKINFHLHITGRRDDGYHTLDSLVAFTNFYDEISITKNIDYHLKTNTVLDCKTEDNLVTRATYMLANQFSVKPDICIDLKKSIPAGSGLGGGSADAAATLNALNHFWKLDAPEPLLQKFASELGSDISACLGDKPIIMRDTGNSLHPAPTFPTLYGILVTPQTPCPTPLVYKAYQESGHKFSQNVVFPNAFDTAHSLCDFLNNQTQNDLTDAAIAVNHDVKKVLDELRNLKDGLLTRLSGSGSSCYTIFENKESALKYTQLMQNARPEWMVRQIEIN
jgi:4-diphosphocytidyl-2-C-methyl-D-erythritol kinase